MEALQTNEQLQTNVKSISIDVDDLLRNKSYMITSNNTFWRIKYEQQAFKHYNIPFPKIISGSMNKYFCSNECAMSHYNAITLAQNLDLPYILIFEDDAYPCIDVITKLKQVLADIPSNIEILLCGYMHEEKPAKVKYTNVNNWKFAKVDDNVIYGTHAYICFNNSYQKIKDVLKEEKVPIDHVYSKKFVKNYMNQCYYIEFPLFLQQKFINKFNDCFNIYKYISLSNSIKTFINDNYEIPYYINSNIKSNIMYFNY